MATWGVGLVGLWALVRGLRSGLAPWHGAALALVSWGSTVLSVLLLPHDLAPPRLLWLVVTVTGLPALLALFRPLREAVVAGLGVSALALVALVFARPAAPIVPNLPVLLAPVFTVGVAIGVRRLIDRCAFEIWRQEESARDVRQGPDEGDAFREHLEERLLGAKPDLIAFLDAITADPSVLDRPATRQEAEQFERVLRSRISPSIDPAFARALAALTAGGWQVRSRLSSDPPAVVQQALAAALAALPRAPETPAGDPDPQVTVTAMRHGGAWQLSLLAHPADAAWAQQYAPGEGWTVSRTYGLHAVCLLPPATGQPPLTAAALPVRTCVVTPAFGASP